MRAPSAQRASAIWTSGDTRLGRLCARAQTQQGRGGRRACNGNDLAVRKVSEVGQAFHASSREALAFDLWSGGVRELEGLPRSLGDSKRTFWKANAHTWRRFRDLKPSTLAGSSSDQGFWDGFGPLKMLKIEAKRNNK